MFNNNFVQWATCPIAMPAMHDGRSRHFATERHGHCRSKTFCFEDEMADF
jgi:hypothetical protein